MQPAVAPLMKGVAELSRQQQIQPNNGGSMSHYIDGFVHPIPRDRLEEYKNLVVKSVPPLEASALSAT